jgi:hypothetical protein
MSPQRILEQFDRLNDAKQIGRSNMAHQADPRSGERGYRAVAAFARTRVCQNNSADVLSDCLSHAA